MGDSVNLMVKRWVQPELRSRSNPVTPIMAEWSTVVSVDKCNGSSIVLSHSTNSLEIWQNEKSTKHVFIYAF